MEDREAVFQFKKITLYSEIIEKRGQWDEDFERQHAYKSFNAEFMNMIEVNGVIVGCVGLQQSNGYFMLRQFFILPEYQGKGLGSAIITDLLTQATGFPVRLKTGRMQNQAIGFYKKHGFTVIEEQGQDYIMERVC